MKNTWNSIMKGMTLKALLLSSLQMGAQNNKQGIVPDTPPSPQAVAFNRLGDYQVNNNYGAPDINIPLFEIDFHGFKIPLALHYEASPLKPGYNYDVTGLGWTLSGNSCVSRTIKDRPDEDGRFNNPFALDPFKNKSGSDKLYLDYADELDRMNYQFDSYNIVLPTGRAIPFFMYKVDGGMRFLLLSLDSKVRISCKKTQYSIDAFTVTDENGIVYNFTLPEKASNCFQDAPEADKNVTWLLSSMDIPAKGTIYYQYTDPVVIDVQNILREPVVTVFRMYDSWSVWPYENRFKVKGHFQSQSPRYTMRFLKSIVYGPTTVDFSYTYNHINEIVVKEGGETIRKYAFDIIGSFLNSLVISGGDDKDKLVYGFTYAPCDPGGYTDYWGNRCKAGPNRKADNGCSINNNGLNDLGNFNLYFGHVGIGKDWDGIQYDLSNNGILAQLIENKKDDNPSYYKLKLQTTTEGDTRIPTSPYQHGVLLSITYPNGGKTLFNWENNSFPTATSADGDIIFDRRKQRIIEGGGFRIESITNYPKNGSSSTDYYRYGFTIGNVIQQDFPLPLPDALKANTLSFNDTINRHIGCGEAVVDPNLFTFMNSFGYSLTAVPGTNSSYSPLYTFPMPDEFRKMLLGKESQFEDISNKQGIPSWWEVTFSASKFRSLVAGRHPVVYPEITVYHGRPNYLNECKSKTVYRYDIYKYQYKKSASIGNYLLPTGQTATPDTAYFEPLFFDIEHPALSCTEYPSERQQLKSKSDYSYNAASHRWELVSEEKYEYTNHDIAKSGFVFDSFISRENYYPNYNGVGSNQTGYLNPLSGFTLRSFYKPATQWIGRAELTAKITAFLRPGATRSDDNTKKEAFTHVFSDVVKERRYTDVYQGTEWNMYWDDKHEFFYDKKDVNYYVGEKYAEDIDNGEEPDSIITAMISRNMQASLLSASTFTTIPTDTLIKGGRIDYKSYGDNILPYKLYENNGCNYEGNIEFVSYDSYGNPTEIVDLKTGVHSVFLWDAWGRYLTAMIRDATLLEVGDVSQLSAENSSSRHATLQARFPSSQIQTWDYKPLIGVISHTDASGQTTLYDYDGLGRLKSESRMVNGTAIPEIIHEYEYNYKNQ